jgi:hypothetical protein
MDLEANFITIRDSNLALPLVMGGFSSLYGINLKQGRSDQKLDV